MKTKELSKQVRDKVVEKYRSGLKKSHCFKKKNKQTRLVFAKRHVGDSPNIWKTILWSDETKMELFGHQGKLYVWRKNQHFITSRRAW
jgi:hypothetical protein